jgi:hypothetical protein
MQLEVPRPCYGSGGLSPASPLRPVFMSGPVHVELLMEKVALGQAFH